MEKLKVLDLFSGIGGFSLGLERTGGFETVAFCEIEEFPRRVLAKHWPKVKCYNDVRELTRGQLVRDGVGPIDIITGGFPCQDISTAGKQAGIAEGTRSGLWSEIVRLIGELRPQFVIVENVANLLRGPSERPGAWFGRVLGDLAECGYDAEWENIPASALGAPHRRERVWIIAYPVKTSGENRSIFSSCGKWVSRTHANDLVSSWPSPDAWKERTEGLSEKEISGFSAFSWRQNVRGVADYFRLSDLPEPLVFRNSDGLPNAVDRVGACGNAVIPQIPELIGNAILQSLEMENK